MPLVEELLDSLLLRPSNRLAVYGTLSRGGVNAPVLDGINGDWLKATLRGEITLRNNLPALKWKMDAREVDVEMLSSVALREKFTSLDRFEGCTYRRILAPVKTSDGFLVANVYESAGD